MARQTEKLSPLQVKRAKVPGYLSDGGGLFLQISEALTKSWVFRFTSPVTGKPREMGLGSVNTWSLAEARQRAREKRQQVDLGIDPIQAKADQRAAVAAEAAKAITFRQAAAAYITAHSPGWRNGKHKDQWENTLDTYAYPKLGDQPVGAIDTAMVLGVLQPIWTEKSETASRLRGRIESILDWAIASGARKGENPARWKPHLKNLLPKISREKRVKHHASLSPDKVPACIAELQGQPGDAATALRLTIINALRTSEVINAKVGEIDLDKALWTIPGERTKPGRPFGVPLTEASLEILRPLCEGRAADDWLFPGARKGKPMSNGAMLMLLERMKRGDITVHGFRGSFRNWASDYSTLRDSSETAEMCLGHVMGDATVRAYWTSEGIERRRTMLAAWAKFCATPRPQGDVVPMKRAKEATA